MFEYIGFPWLPILHHLSEYEDPAEASNDFINALSSEEYSPNFHSSKRKPKERGVKVKLLLNEELEAPLSQPQVQPEALSLPLSSLAVAVPEALPHAEGTANTLAEQPKQEEEKGPQALNQTVQVQSAQEEVLAKTKNLKIVQEPYPIGPKSPLDEAAREAIKQEIASSPSVVSPQAQSRKPLFDTDFYDAFEVPSAVGDVTIGESTMELLAGGNVVQTQTQDPFYDFLTSPGSKDNRIFRFGWRWTDHPNCKEFRNTDRIISVLKTIGATEIVFQLERGPLTKKLHYQGYFHITPKKRIDQVRKILSEAFFNIDIRHAHDADSLKKYCQKEETREAGPWCFP